MASVDLTVRGGGIFGLSIAWEAARRGAVVRLIEPVAVGAGASGGVVGALAPHTPDQWNPKKAFQLESLLMAAGWWGGVEAISGLPSGYGRTGRLQPVAATDLLRARARALSAQDLWGGAAEWRLVPVTGAAWEPASASGLLIHDTLSARIQPRMALAALVEAIVARGGEIVPGDAAEVGPVIWATGVAGLDALTESLGRVVGGAVKGQAAVLRFDAPDAPQLLIDGLHIVPHANGTVAVGSTSETQWDSACGTDARLEALLARVRAVLPVLGDAPVIERWAGLRPRARSRAPVLGAWPGRAGHYLANGGFKIGFGMAPMVARVMVDLVLDAKDAVPPEFRVNGL